MRRDEIWTIIGGASLALLLWIGIAGLIWSDRAESEARIARSGQTLAAAVAGQTDRALTAGDRLLRLIAAQAARSGASPDHPAPDLSTFDLKALDAAVHLTDPLVPLFAVADAQGRIVQSTLAGPVQGIDIADREHFRVHAEQRVEGLFISPPVLGRVSGRWMILLTRAIRRADGGFAGTVIASVDPSGLRNVYAGLDPGPAGIIALLGEDGRIRVRTDEGPEAGALGAKEPESAGPEGGDLRGTPLLAFALSGAPGPFAVEEPAPADRLADPLRRLYVARHLPDYPLIALIGLDERWVALGLFRERLFHVALGVAVTALIGLFVFIVCYRLRHQAGAEARLREAIEGMPDGFILFDRHDRLIAWNRCYEAIFPYLKPVLRPGIRFAELARYAAHFVTGSDDDAVREGWAQWRIERHLSQEPTFNQALADGRVLETAERSTSDGGVVSVTRDITVLRRGEATLAAAQARFRDFALIASDWFWETDALHRFTFVSERAERALVFATTLQRLDNMAEGSAALQDALMLQAPFRNQMLILTAESESLHFMLTGMPIRDEEGRFLGYRGCARNLTGQRAAEMALRAEIAAEQRQARGTLLAELGERVRSAAATAPEDRAAALAALADNAAELAELERGEIRLERGWFSIEAVLGEVVLRFGDAAQLRRLRFETHYATGPVPMLWGDPPRIRRLVELLADNAVRHAANGTEPRVATFVIGLERHEGARCALVIEVHDQGGGIPSWAQPGLFDRTGGFGLKIFRALVQLMAGEFGMTSEPGVGSTFWFRLPLEAESAVSR